MVITISDTGGGIPESIRARIFDPFFTTKEVGQRHRPGPLDRAQRHRRVMAARSISSPRSAQGTTFFVRLPLCKEDGETAVA